MIEITDMMFAYQRSPFRLTVPSMTIAKGEKAALIGASGSGKTTLLNLAAGILLPDSGSVRVADTEVSRLSDSQRRRFRIANIGMIFQEFELLEYLNVRENILMPFRVNGALVLDQEVHTGLQELALSLEIASLLNRYPRRLSQGERQRVAIGRALITRPKLIFADEPTGNLDPHTSEVILCLIFEQIRLSDATVLMVTHDHSLLSHFDRVIDLDKICCRAHAEEGSP
jgi:ABC-type lipoprotein export system ATPase subunit